MIFVLLRGGQVLQPAEPEPGPRETGSPATSRSTSSDEVQGQRYHGVVLGRRSVDVAAEIEGRLDELRVRIGDLVTRQQKLAKLDDSMVRHQLAKEKAALRAAVAEQGRKALEVARAADQRAQRQALGDLISKEDLAASQYEHEITVAAKGAVDAQVAEVRARVEQLETTLRLTEIRAPFDGQVAVCYLEAGEFVSLGTPLVRIISSMDLLVRFAVPVETAGTVAVGMAVKVVAEPLSLKAEGIVERIAPEIDPASGRVFMEASLELPPTWDRLVPSGMPAWVSVSSSPPSK